MLSRIYFMCTLIICFVILFLANTEQLTNYVHPRYVVFTVITVSVAIILLLVSFFQGKTKEPAISPAVWFCIILAIPSLLFPPKTLSGRIASDRLQDHRYNNESIVTSFDSFSQDFSHFDIADWSNILSSNPNSEELADKKAVVEGFILKDNNEIYIARFRLSCCAVDATPLTVPLAESAKALENNKWYRIEGVFVSQNGLRLNPVLISEIEEPNEPYIY